MVGMSSNGPGPRPGGNPTIDDVAHQAGVSRTTVSRVLNNGANVRPVMREKVMQAVAELGFKANVQARALAGRVNGSLALVHQSDLDTEPNSYYHAALELGALRACANSGFQILTRTVNPDVAKARREIEEMFRDGRIAGMIVTPPLSDDPLLSMLAQSHGWPIAFVSADPGTSPAGPAFGIDDFAAGRDLARHLIELGHRRFGYIHGPAGHRSAERRFAGLRQALDEAGLGGESLQEEQGSFTFRSGIEAAERIVAHSPRPTALMCGNDDMAAGALLALHRAGLDIPRDMSVTGFDGTPISEIVWPPLTTVLQPIKQIGHDAASRLIAAIAGDNDAAAPERHHAGHEVIVRESTAPPAR
jgi:LacI family transcriptional regulator